ncbi:MAG: hypothetical protein KGS72_10925 [Cyanobacteria bacterium REEB67]|nr:hypothetical protein [Cyanobacteria bacterium REEB67]
MKKIGRWGLSGIAVGAIPMILILGYDVDSTEGMVIALLFFPFAALLLPWYAAFCQNNWIPVIFVYLLGGISCVLMSFGEPVDPFDETR